MSTAPTPSARLANGDAVFRALPVVVLPGYRRPLIRVRDYLELLARSTYDGSRVR